MKHASLKFKSYAGSARIVNNDNLEARILHALLFSFGALAIVYVFILWNMVFNIIGRRTLEIEARNLSNEVGQMELNYLTMSNKVDINMGHSLGFKEAKATFATRKAVGSLGSVKVSQNDL